MKRLSLSLAAVVMLGAAWQTDTAKADDRVWRTSTSLIGKSKYEGGFTHYEHANPDAPKGGVFNSMALGTYDSFNPFIVQGSVVAGVNYQSKPPW